MHKLSATASCLHGVALLLPHTRPLVTGNRRQECAHSPGPVCVDVWRLVPPSADLQSRDCMQNQHFGFLNIKHSERESRIDWCLRGVVCGSASVLLTYCPPNPAARLLSQQPERLTGHGRSFCWFRVPGLSPASPSLTLLVPLDCCSTPRHVKEAARNDIQPAIIGRGSVRPFPACEDGTLLPALPLVSDLRLGRENLICIETSGPEGNGGRTTGGVEAGG